MNKLPPNLLVELIELRNILDAISQISWSFSVLNKNYPIGELTEYDVDVIREEYLTLIRRAKEIVANVNE